MKRIILAAIGAMAILAGFTSCIKDNPDGLCEITSFALQNPNTGEIIQGTIDQTGKTISLVVPAADAGKQFLVNFNATEYDEVSVGGIAIYSGMATISATDGMKIDVKDDVSAMTNSYTLVVKQNDGTAELVAVAFKKADNSALTEDVIPAEIAPEMVVRVPGEAFQKELTMTVEAGAGDKIKVNGADVENGAGVKVDTSFPVDITVSDEVAGISNQYVVKVGKILEVIVTKLGTYTEGTIATSDLDVAINPADGLPYFGFVRKVGEDKYNGMSVVKWDGNAFSNVGASGFSNSASRAASKPHIAFAEDGTLFAYYVGGAVANRPTVMKYSGEWAYVGQEGNTSVNVNTSYAYPFFVLPGSTKPAFFYNGNTKNTPSYRTMNFNVFNGDSWSESVVTGTVPAYGSGSTANSGMYYTSDIVAAGEKRYIGSSFNEFGYYIHEVGADGSLTSIVDNYIPAGEKCGLPGNVSIAADGEGNLYFLGAVWSGAIMQLYKVDIAGKTMNAYGTGIPVSISSSGGVSTKVEFGINPVSGLFVAAYDDTEGPAFIFINESLQWNKFEVSDAAAAKTDYKILFNKEGNGYIAYISANGIELYGIGLEADIIPE